jgi:hypothetical protein
MESRAKRKLVSGHQLALLLAIAITALTYFVPYLSIAFRPLVYLSTHIHEFCHAIVGTLTGGSVDRIEVFSNGGGVTLIAGGNDFLIDPAGYLGATGLGIAMILFGRTPSRAKIALGAMGILLVFSMLFWVRGDIVGITFGMFWMMAMLGAAALIKGPAAVFACQFVGIQQCVNALTSVFVLFHITVVSTEAQSDAVNMAAVTHLPAVIWASLWSFMSVVGIALAIREAWRPIPAPSRTPIHPAV